VPLAWAEAKVPRATSMVGSTAIKECANDFLEALGTGVVKGWRVINRWHQLCGGAVCWCHPCVGRIFGPFGCCVLEFVQCVGNVTGHGEIDRFAFIVPIDGEAEEFGCGPVSSYLIYLGNALDQVFGVFTADVTDAQVVNNQTLTDLADSISRIYVDQAHAPNFPTFMFTAFRSINGFPA
jgi:hypothetical protein